MANILAWAERVLKEVDSATGHSIARVRLINVEGHTWETWVPPFGKMDDLVREIQAVLEALEAEWPVKRVQMALIAEDAQGTTHSTLTFTACGKNKNAAAGALGGEGSRAFVEQLEGLTRSVERLLAMQNNQVRLVDERSTSITQAYHDLLEFTRAKAEAEALAAQQSAQSSGELSRAIAAHFPQLLEVAQLFVPPGVRKALAVAQVAAAMGTSAVNGTTNGSGAPNGHPKPNGSTTPGE